MSTRSPRPATFPRFRTGVIGAGRVGAVLAARLRAAVQDIAAVSGTSEASRTRVETLLPGARPASPHEVARQHTDATTAATR